MKRRAFESVHYLVAVTLLTVAVAGLAWWVRDATLGLSAGILGLYVLHLLSIRFILQAQREQREALDEQWELLEQLVGRGTLPRAGPRPERPTQSGRRPGAGPDTSGTAAPVPRHFALGTVALVRKMLAPEDVVRILLEQRQRPDRRFGETAIYLGLLTETQLEELLLAQQEGLFTDEEIEEARERLEAFRRTHLPTAAD